MKRDKDGSSVRFGIKRAKKTLEAEMNLDAAFQRFIEYHPAARFNRNLRKMLMEFMMVDAAVEAFYLRDLLYDLEGLFELLDAVSESELTGLDLKRRL